MKKPTSKIIWRSVADELPDGPATVLVALRDPELPVWLGYWENDFWNDVDGSGYAAGMVTHWADLPSKPFQP